MKPDALEKKYNEQLLHAVNSTAAVLLAPENDEKFETALLKGMELMGNGVGVDRINIWQNETVDDSLCFVLKQEWFNGNTRYGKTLPINTKISYDEKPEWRTKFSMGEYINGPFSGLSQEDRLSLEPYQIKSILIIPVHLEEQFWGFVCFVDCHRERTFSEAELNILRSGSLMMVNMMNRNIQAVQIHEAQRNTQALLDAMPLIIQLWNRNGKMFDCSEESINLFKLKDKQECIDRFFELSPDYQPDGRPSKEQALIYLDKAFEEGGCVFEWMHQTTDGQPLPAEITLARVRFSGKYVVASYVRDLREHKRMMREIEKRDDLLNTVNNAAVVLIQGGIDEFVNQLQLCMGMIGKAINVDRVCICKNHTYNNKLCFTQIYEWVDNAESLIGKDGSVNISYDISAPGWKEILSQNKCINNIVSKMSERLQEELKPQGILSVFVAPVFSSGEFWGFISFEDCHSENIFSENEQSILRSGSLIIANALLRNDLALNIRDSAAKLEAVIVNYPGIIWCVDQNNIITLFHGQYLYKEGIDPKAFEGRNVNEALSDYRFNEICKSVEKTFKEGPQDINTGIDDRMYRLRTTPIKDETGRVVNVVGNFDDITDRTRLQTELKEALTAAQEANEAKSKFLAHMSHEMRTPLNAVIGLSEMSLYAGGLSEDVEANLERINSSGMTLLSTVNDILDISKIEAGKFELVPVEYDTPSLLNDAITQSNMRIGEKPIKFELSIDENIPARLFGDDLKVKQILNNLLSNAFKYTQEGTVKLEVNCEKAEEGMVWLTARVSDTGIGIRDENLADLFIDYAKMDMKSNRAIEGTGLGLPITKRIAGMMDGTINVESAYGKGSVFTVKVKQKLVNGTVIGMEIVNSLKTFNYSDRKRRQISKMTRLSLSYARVLVVDDIVINLEVVKGMMKPYGMRIDCVTSGQQAIDAIREEKVRYNAVFMDHMMPEMDGIEAARIIREEIGTEYARKIPIIALTANAILGNEEMFLKNGFQAFISKPVEISRLDAVIREWVRDEELEKTLGHVNVNGENILDTRTGQDRRVSGDAYGRRKGPRRLADGVIKGLDFDKGVERFGGDRDAYMEILRSFAKNTPPLLESIRNVTADNLDERGNANGYAITVHGIKGSSRNISAVNLGDMAEALEKAAKSANFNYVTENNAAFIAEAEKLIGELEVLLQKTKVEKAKPKKDKPDRETLKKLSEACGKYDMDAVDAAIAEIEKYEYKTESELIIWLKDNIAKINFKEIKEKLKSLV